MSAQLAKKARPLVRALGVWDWMTGRFGAFLLEVGHLRAVRSTQKLHVVGFWAKKVRGISGDDQNLAFQLDFLFLYVTTN